MNEAVRREHELYDSGSSLLDLDSMRVALEAGLVGVWSWDFTTGTLKWSAFLEQIHGLSPGSFEGTVAAFQREIHPEDQPDVLAAVQESMRSGKPYHVLYRLTPRDDQDDRWVEAMASVIQRDGEPVQMLGICRDITDRQKLLLELRARAKQQETAARLSERALTEVDLQKLFDEVATTVADILGVEFVKILELVPGDAEMLLRAGTGWKPGVP